MRPDAWTDAHFTPEPVPELVQLAQFNDSDRPVVSCYLDTRGGAQQGLAFLNAKAGHIRESLRGVDRLDFDTAIEMIRRRLDRSVGTGSAGIAVFARGAMGGRHLTLIETAAAAENRLVYSRSPEILPLMALEQCQPAGRVLLARRDGFELLSTRLGPRQRPLCEGRLTSSARGPDTQGRPDAHAEALRACLATTQAPLLLAGDTDSLIALSDALPDEATVHLVGCIRLAADADRASVLEIARNRLAAIQQSEAKRLAHAIADHRHPCGSVLGFRPVMDTLLDGAADTVVVSDWDRFGQGLPWESKVEICLAALRNGARLVLCDSVRLREAGGVGCLLREDHSLQGQVARQVATPDVFQAVA